MDFDLEKISVKQTALQVSKRKFLLADATKFNASALCRVAHLQDFDVVVTDADMNSQMRERLQDTTVIMAR